MEGEMEVLRKEFANEKATLTSELDQERTKMESQIASYKEQLTSLQTTLDRMKKQNKTTNEEKGELVAALEEADRAKNKAEKQVRKLENDLHETQADLREKNSRVASLEEQKKQAEHRMHDYKSRLEEAEAAKTTIDAIKKNLEVEVEEISTQLEEASKFVFLSFATFLLLKITVHSQTNKKTKRQTNKTKQNKTKQNKTKQNKKVREGRGGET